MYTVTLKSDPNNNYYNITLCSNDNSHYLNIYIAEVDKVISITISKSEDNFYFKSPCEESSDLKIESSTTLEDVFNQIKNHFFNKGYKTVGS